MPAVRFWFDLASTYSYLAALRLEPQARAWEVPVVWQPFLLGPIFRHQGWDDSPFNLNAVRGAYMWRDVARQAESAGLPFRKPSAFPRNSVLAARIACAGEGEVWLPAYARAVFRANFEQDQDIADEEVLRAALRAAAVDPDPVLERALAPESRGRLRARTEQAWELGIFGAPTFEVDGELFWGNDRMEQAFAWYGRRPVACDLGSLTPEERERRANLAELLRVRASEARARPEGLAFRVPREAMPPGALDELVGLERRCCPFLRFALEREGDDLVLEIAGDSAEARAFLRTQFGAG